MASNISLCVGVVEPFIDADPASWNAYTERLGCYFEANDITADKMEKRQAIFLSACGTKTYNTLRQLTAPAIPPEKPLPELLALLKEYYCPELSVIFQRHLFHRRDQKTG